MLVRICFCILLTTLTATAQNTPPTFGDIDPIFIEPFVDEGLNDPEFNAFRMRLINAVEARDIETVLSMSSPDIFLQGGWTPSPEDQGRERFRMNLAGEIESEGMPPEEITELYWQQLAQVLRLGGHFDEETMVDGKPTQFKAPYHADSRIHSHFNFENIGNGRRYTDGYSELFSISHNAPLYETTSDDAEIIGRLHYGEAVYNDENSSEYDPKAPMMRILRSNGQIGYVRKDQVRAWLNFYVNIRKVDDVWMLVAFAAEF